MSIKISILSTVYEQYFEICVLSCSCNKCKEEINAMKKKKETVILFTLLISAVLIFIIIAACAAAKAKTKDKPITEDSAEEITTGSSDSLNDMRLSYYESELQRLEEELLTLKSDKFISESKSQSKISELEKKIEELNNEVNDTSKGSQYGQSGQLIHYTDPDITTVGEDTTTAVSDDREQMKFNCVISGERIIILAYLGNAKDVTIPSYIESQPVYEIADDAFRGCDITSVIIPSTVTKIGKLAFFGCKDLKSVTIPPSVQMIGIAAFDSCNSDFTIKCEKDSYAYKFAVSAGIKYEIIN